MIGDESPIGQACGPITQWPSKLVQLSKIRSLIRSILRRMGWIYLNEGFRNMPHHGHRVLRVHPYVRIPSFAFLDGMSPAIMVQFVTEKRDAFGGGDDPERCAPGILHQRGNPDFKADPDFEQQPGFTDGDEITRFGGIGMFVFVAA